MADNQLTEKEQEANTISSDKNAAVLFMDELELIKVQLNTLTDKYGLKDGVSLQMNDKRGWWAAIDIDKFK